MTARLRPDDGVPRAKVVSDRELTMTARLQPAIPSDSGPPAAHTRHAVCCSGYLALATAGVLLGSTSPARADALLAPLAPWAFDALDRNRDAPASEHPNYQSDGVYGRFDGEISVVPSIGVERAEAGGFTQLGLSAFYLSTVGVTVRTAEGSLSPWKPRADFNVSTLSLALRPLFLLRWSQDWEAGPSFLDLTIDSLTLSLGGYWSSQRENDTQRRGLESELSFGFPILAKAHGPWLTLSVANRLPRLTHAGHSLDMIYGLRFEWSFSLGS